MSFPQYPKYKESSVEWLGDVPEHWHCSDLRWLSRRYSGGTPDKAKPEYFTDGTIPWLNSGAVNQSLITEASEYITEDAFANSSAKWIPAGALVMALAGQGKTKGMVAQLGFASTCNQSMAAIVPTSEVVPRFLLWWLTANYQNIRNMAGGDLRDGLNLELLGDIPCPLPPKAEQTKIAHLLDRETAEIDALIDEQQRLIELLKEKCQAVISHAVTRGLNENVALKPSGVEWLGEIPAHWTVSGIKRVATLFGRIGYRGYTTGDIVDEGEGAIALSPTNMVGGELSLSKCTYISWEKYEQSPEIVVANDDVLMVKTGSTLGKLMHVAEVQYPMTINPQLVIFKRIKCIPRFLFFALSIPALQAQIQNGNSGSSIPTIAQDLVGRLLVAMPPDSEQELIVQYIDHRMRQLEKLSTEAQHAIQILMDRRSALITAAVTGKIDVRHLAGAEAA